MTPSSISSFFQRIAFISIAIAYNSNTFLVFGGYPFSSDDLSVRQSQILDKLRGDMTLLINEEIVPSDLREPSFGEQFLRNVEVYICAFLCHTTAQND